MALKPESGEGVAAGRGASPVYDRVNAQILAALGKGVVPWRKPWTRQGAFLHRNATTGHAYRGINVFLLAMAQAARGFASPRWLTYRQAGAAGGYVKSGERSTTVVLWKQVPLSPRPGMADPTKDGGEESRTIPLLRYYNVFNVEQCADLDPAGLIQTETPQVAAFSPIERGERILSGYMGGPKVTHGGTQAYYRLLEDAVTLPAQGDFHSVPEYYATLFHELTHSTGHANRLDRATLRGFRHFGDDLYAREELVAEMGSAFLLGHAGIEAHIESHAAYLKSWMRRIQDEPKLMVVAAGQAQRATEWILSGARTHQPPASPTSEGVAGVA